MRYSTVIFDLDGTLLDTLQDLTDACNYTLGTFNFPPRTLEEVRTFIGNGIRTLLRRAVPSEASEETIDLAFSRFIPYYQEHCIDKTRPYAGIKELVWELHDKGVQTAVVSNKADPAVQKMIPFFFGDLFDAVTGEKKGVPRKPAPDSLRAVMGSLQADPAKTVYIGDSGVDIETAKNAGIPCISVTWGFRSREVLLSCKAETLADDVPSLQKLL